MTGRIPMAHYFYPFTFKQGADNAGTEADAAYILNFAPGDGLLVGNNSQGFQQRLGITLGSFIKQPVYPLCVIRTSLKTKSTGHFLQFHAAFGIILP